VTVAVIVPPGSTHSIWLPWGRRAINSARARRLGTRGVSLEDALDFQHLRSPLELGVLGRGLRDNAAYSIT
jgi:hypothetical protein